MKINEKILMLDTETTNTIDDPLCYDIGFAVVDTSGKIYASYSYVVAEVFLDKSLMEYAYFAEKIPQYWDDIKNGYRTLARLYTIRKKIREIMEFWGINKVCAHNCRFDYRSTNLTQRFLTCSKYRYFFPYGTQFIDTLKMARSIYGKNQEYIDYCTQNNYTTERGKPRFTAEILYRYISQDENFCEEHTGLADVRIETQILANCLKINPKINGRLW